MGLSGFQRQPQPHLVCIKAILLFYQINERLMFKSQIILGLLIWATLFSSCSRLSHVIHLFDEDKIVENFRTLQNHFPTKTMPASTNPYHFPKGNPYELPTSFNYQNESVASSFFMEGSKTTGFIVIQNDSIVLEEYFLGNSESTQNISWSVAKSFIATIFGIAIDEGYIKSVDQKVEEYVPELIGSGYEGVSIKDVLQMSSGVAFDEDYGKFFSDINRWGRTFAFGGSQNKFASKMKRERTPGTYHKYVSIDTHVLGMILSNATGQSITNYMHEKLWEPLGMEHDGLWGVDKKGMEVALCGMIVTLRDYAKLGVLYANEGRWNNEQIVSKSWIEDATTTTEAHLIPGENPLSNHDLGYGYQWWLLDGVDGEFLAQGVYNQNIYVNPSTNTVIVKLSANDKFNDNNYLPTQHQAAIAFYRAISRELAMR